MRNAAAVLLSLGLLALLGTGPAPATAVPAGAPDLVLNAAEGWSAPIVISTGSGDHDDDFPLLPSDTLRLDLHATNVGDVTVPESISVYYYLYVDDHLELSWSDSWEWYPGGTVTVTDLSLGSLPPGLHTIRVKVDATNAVAESNETNNAYTKTIWVGDTGWLYEEDFNSGAPAGWSATGGLWHLSTSCSAALPGHSTPQTMYFGLDGDCGFETGGTTSGNLSHSSVIDLTAAPAELSLIFKYLLDTENTAGYDEASVLFSLDYGPWQVLDRDASNGGTLDDDGFWSTAVYDVSSWAGHGVRLTFSFDSVDENFNFLEGWHVDDVGINELGSKRPRSLLWTQDGLAMAWMIAGEGSFGGMQGFGTETNWRATSYEKDAQGAAHLVWSDAAAGLAMVWHLTSIGTWGTMEGFGLAPGWTLTGYQRNPDGSAHLLWTDGNGAAQVWTITSEGGWGGSTGFDGGAGWTATSYRRNPDGTAQLVWAKPSTGQAMIWTLTDGGGWGGMLGLGISAGWAANGWERNPDGSGVLLWANAATGQAMAWTITPAATFGGMQGFGVSAGWEAGSYLRNR